MSNEYFNTYYQSTDPLVEEELFSVHFLINSSLVVIAIPSHETTLTFYPNSPNFAEVVKLASNYLTKPNLTEAQVQELICLRNIKKKLNAWSNQKLEIVGDSVVYNKEPLPESLEHFILTSFEQEADFNSFVKPWEQFLDKLAEVQSMEVYENIHNFLVHSDLKINEEGNVIAYKAVNPDFTDIYTGKIDNSVGATVTEDRRKISSDSNSTCSFGLHACSLDYLRNSGYANSGSKMIEISVDVRDIVCVPNDYHGTKIRVCKYTVEKYLGDWQVDFF